MEHPQPPAVIWQLDPELDTFSFAHFPALRLAIDSGLALAESEGIHGCVYRRYVSASDPDPERWHLTSPGPDTPVRSYTITRYEVMTLPGQVPVPAGSQSPVHMSYRAGC